MFFTALFGFVLLRERASLPLQAGLVLVVAALACVLVGPRFMKPR